MRIFEVGFELEPLGFLGDQLLPHIFKRPCVDEHLAGFRPRIRKANDRLIEQVERDAQISLRERTRRR